MGGERHLITIKDCPLNLEVVPPGTVADRRIVQRHSDHDTVHFINVADAQNKNLKKKTQKNI